MIKLIHKPPTTLTSTDSNPPTRPAPRLRPRSVPPCGPRPGRPHTPLQRLAPRTRPLPPLRLLLRWWPSPSPREARPPATPAASAAATTLPPTRLRACRGPQ
jgi:hypothetical protein